EACWLTVDRLTGARPWGAAGAPAFTASVKGSAAAVLPTWSAFRAIVAHFANQVRVRQAGPAEGPPYCKAVNVTTTGQLYTDDRKPRGQRSTVNGESETRHRVDQLLHRSRRLLELLLLVRLELDLHDLLDALAAQAHRHADEQAVHAELALAERGARQHALLVVEDRVDHLRHR